MLLSFNWSNHYEWVGQQIIYNKSKNHKENNLRQKEQFLYTTH